VLRHLRQHARGAVTRLRGVRPAVQEVTEGPLRGARLLLDPGSPYAGDYEPAFAQALLRLARPGATAVDAGAHHGYFTVLLARAVGPEGAVVSFEADPDNAAVVRRNVELNDLRNVTVEQAAVADREAEDAPLFAARAGGSMEWTLSQSFAEREGGGAPHGVAGHTRLVSLSGFLADRPVSLIKMDIEGAEALALPAALEWLQRTRPHIVLEFHREVGWPAIEALREAGYRMEALDGTPLEWPQSADDVPYQLVASPGGG
jgi:FkbM family methyltransferase